MAGAIKCRMQPGDGEWPNNPPRASTFSPTSLPGCWTRIRAEKRERRQARLEIVAGPFSVQRGARPVFLPGERLHDAYRLPARPLRQGQKPKLLEIIERFGIAVGGERDAHFLGRHVPPLSLG